MMINSFNFKPNFLWQYSSFDEYKKKHIEIKLILYLLYNKHERSHISLLNIQVNQTVKINEQNGQRM